MRRSGPIELSVLVLTTKKKTVEPEVIPCRAMTMIMNFSTVKQSVPKKNDIKTKNL